MTFTKILKHAPSYGTTRAATAGLGSLWAALAASNTSKAGPAGPNQGAVSSQWNQARDLYHPKKYNKKSKKRNRKRKRFANAVERVINKQVYGNRTMFFNSVGQHASIAGAQGVTTVSLGLSESNPETDLVQLFVNEGVTFPSAEIFLKTGRLDCTFKNNNATETAIVDVYVLGYKPMSFTAYNGAMATPISILDNITGDVETQAAAGSSLTSQEIGWTPFANGLIGKYVKVCSHTRFILAQGQHQTYTLKENYNKKIQYEPLKTSAVVPYLTKSLLFIIQGRPNAGAGASTEAAHYPAVGLDFEWTRQYWYQRLTDNQTYAGEENV